MNKIVGLLIVVGLVFAVYVNREKIASLRGGGAAETSEQEQSALSEVPGTEVAPPTASPGGLTPNPAKESQALALRLYPGLSLPNSALNKKFLALHAEARQNDPALLARPDWPITLAERAMIALGGVPLSRTTPPPVQHKPLPGTAMDKRPGK